MSVPHKNTIQATFLIVLAACARPAGSGLAARNVAAAPAPPTPPTTTAPGPAPVLPVSAVDNLYGSLLEDYYPGSPRGAVPVLVIPAEELDGETFSRIVEDLTIMSRIIEKSIRNPPVLADLAVANQVQQIYGRNIFLQPDPLGPNLLRPSQGRPKPMYIGGYGAVFSLQVAFPLLPPPEAPKQDKTAEQTDEVWAQAQRELLAPQAALHPQHGAPEAPPYSPEAVEIVRSTLVAVLKHATNIRDLGPESWLAILVQGPSPSVQDRPQNAPPYGRRIGLLFGAPAGGRTLLTLRAKKADIDQYARGQLDETQFQQRVQIVTY